MDENNTMIQCSSTHLTSFAILVNVGGSVTPTVSCSKAGEEFGMKARLVNVCMIWFQY